LTTNSNSSGDFADEELLKSTARRNSSFPIGEEDDGGDDDRCSCKMDDVQSNGDSDQVNEIAFKYSRIFYLAITLCQFAKSLIIIRIKLSNFPALVGHWRSPSLPTRML
jgi:hypothetical protein